MNTFFKTLRARLILWYVGSIAFFTLFFYIAVHTFDLPHSDHIYIVLFALFTIIGIFIIYRITKSITYLSTRIRHISRKNLDERILDINSEDEIGELAASFNNLLDHLHEAFKRERQFIGDVAHELKTPLATLKSTLEVSVSKNRTNKEYQDAIKTAIEETNQLSATLNNVLDLAWAEVHEDNKSTHPFNLSELMEEVGDISEKMAEAKHITVTADIEKGVNVSGFRDKLARALLNIVDNAIKYSGANTSLFLKLEKTHNRAFITIKDTGIGIQEHDIPHIFDRFYRAAKTEKISGSGLGLAITKSVISLHQGHINVESKQNQGTTCTIILPLA